MNRRLDSADSQAEREKVLRMRYNENRIEHEAQQARKNSRWTAFIVFVCVAAGLALCISYLFIEFGVYQ